MVIVKLEGGFGGFFSEFIFEYLEGGGMLFFFIVILLVMFKVNYKGRLVFNCMVFFELFDGYMSIFFMVFFFGGSEV